MWFLEHESLFGGKRVWLKPGTRQLFGRTRNARSEAENSVFIDQKTVSRRHMMIEVLQVPPEDGTKLRSRSQVVITDLSCKQGTSVDGGEKLVSKKEGSDIVADAKVTLSGTEHTIRLTASYPEFKVKWQPMVFTYASKDTVKSRTAQLHSMDIKTSTEFVHNFTTHVVSEKRNLPKVLQGLVAARHIVSTTFLDTIIERAIPQNDDIENYRASMLEEDFDAAWPKEKEYVAPIGKEPVARPEQMLEPDTERSEMFSGLTFVFLDERQHSSLQDVVSTGSGKALMFSVTFGETTVDEYVQYVTNVAGQKKRPKANNGRLPVVTVRPTPPAGMEAWVETFIFGTDKALNQRSIQQNEFLDAILTKDVSSLQKPPAEDEIMSSALPTFQPNGSQREPTQLARSVEQPQSTPAFEAEAEPVRPNPRKRPMRRGVTQSRFTGFDDYEPPPKVRKVEEEVPMEDIPESMPAQNSVSQTQQRTTQASKASRNDPSPPEESRQRNTINPDSFAPAAAEMRRRRAANRGSQSVEPESVQEQPKTKGAQVLERLQKAKKKSEKEIDVLGQTRQRVKQEEEQRRLDEENLREQLEGVDISEMRNLGKVITMDVEPRQDRPVQRAASGGREWKDEWNGRKNFKKFRRRGAERGPQQQKVLVTLEQAPQKKGFGYGDAFFLEDTEDKARTKEDDRRLRRRGVPVSDSEDEPGGFSRRRRFGRAPAKEKEPEVIMVVDSGPDDEEEEPVVSSNRSRTQRVAETQTSSTQAQKGAKRAPVTVAAGQPASKRPRTMRRNADSDDEETGFRFRRKK